MTSRRSSPNDDIVRSSINKLQTAATEKKQRHQFAAATNTASSHLRTRIRQGLTATSSAAFVFRSLFVVYVAFVCISFWKSSHKLQSRHVDGGAQKGSSISKSDNGNNNSKKKSDVMMSQQQRVLPAVLPSGITAGGTGTSTATTTMTTTTTESSLLVFDETPKQLNMLNKVFCMGQFGLGHRLSKLAAAYHLTCQVLELPRLQVHWGSCNNSNSTGNSQEHDNGNDDDEIFASLFGTNRLQCPSPSLSRQQQDDEANEARSLYQNKTIVIRNDVIGYYAGQAYKNAQVPIDMVALTGATTSSTSHYNHHAWLSKLDLDTKLFQDLVHHFYSRNVQRIQAFQQEHDWRNNSLMTSARNERLVIGLHIRAGNGEQDHFQAARRDSLFESSQQTTFADQLASLIHQLIQHEDQDISSPTTIKHQAPLVFLATDTAEFIPILQNAFANNNNNNNQHTTAVKVVTFPQERVPTWQGVSYQQWTQGQSCRNGWQDSFMDMVMLSQSDIVIAATRSTFTQILPQALVWNKNTQHLNNNNNMEKPRLKFCQVGRRVSNHRAELIMSCFANQRTWLFGPPRNNGGTPGEQVKTYVSQFNLEEEVLKSTKIMETVDETNTSKSSATDVNVVDRHGSVVHKILVHFPDVEQDSLTQRAMSFLQNPATVGQVFAYGRRIATKYRGKRNEEFRADWTII